MNFYLCIVVVVVVSYIIIHIHIHTYITIMVINLNLIRFYLGAEKTIKSAKNYLNTHGGPFVILVRRQTFLPYKGKNVADKKFEHTRESAMKLVVDNISEKDCVVSTTGMLSRELFEYRAAKEQGNNN
eukprot:Pgem_evm1s3049